MKHSIFVLLLGLNFVVNPLRAEIIVHETFADGRESQNPPHSLAWRALVIDSASVKKNTLTLKGAEESPRVVVASFPAVKLNPGDRFELTFDFTLGGEIGYKNGALRVGLYSLNFGPQADGEDPKTEGTGYLVSFNNARHTSGKQAPFTGSTFFERIVDGARNPDPRITSTENHLRLKASGIRPGYFEADISYSVKFGIEFLTDTSLRLISRTAGGLFTDENDFEVLVESDRGQLFTEFNTVVLGINASGDEEGGFPQIGISNIKLEVIRGVPSQ